MAVAIETDHLVQFYESDAFLTSAVARFVGLGLEAGAGGVVIATGPHLEGIEAELRARGVDLDAARRRGRYVPLDAGHTLSQLMRDGRPDEQRFTDVVGAALARAADVGGAPVRAFGELVALLAARGEHDAAIQLEALWNGLARTQRFSLLCGYPLRVFPRAADTPAFLDVCEAHSQVLPADGYAEAPDADARLDAIARLQQRAHALEAEVAERRDLERRLREKQAELAELLASEQAARAEAERLARARDQMLAAVSHELRTPLTAMAGWLRILRTESLDPARTAYALEVIERNTRVQARLIDDLLDVSRIVTGHMRLEVGPVDLAGLVRTVVEGMRPAAEAKAIQLGEEIDPGVEPVAGDVHRLQQVVWNLLSNAVKYTPSDGRVEVRLSRVDSTVRLTVTDTGVGVRPDFLPRLFEPFSQANGGSSRARAGLGLGLSIVRHLVELHGGRVEAESPGDGLGTTFTVSLPGTVAWPNSPATKG